MREIPLKMEEEEEEEEKLAGKKVVEPMCAPYLEEGKKKLQILFSPHFYLNHFTLNARQKWMIRMRAIVVEGCNDPGVDRSVLLSVS